MQNIAKSAAPSRLVAVLSAKDLAVVDELATAANVTREEALKQLLMYQLERDHAGGTIH